MLIYQNRGFSTDWNLARLFLGFTAPANRILGLWEEYGADYQEIGGATAAFFTSIPITAFNRVIALGVNQPATEQMVDELMERYGRTFQPLLPQYAEDGIQAGLFTAEL